MNEKAPLISSHQTLAEALIVNWFKDYDGGFQCPNLCSSKELSFGFDSTNRIRATCKSCQASAYLFVRLIHPCISTHETLHGELKINWRKDYDGSFQCPAECGSKSLSVFWNKTNSKVQFKCKSCKSYSLLACECKIPCISTHKTLHGELKINWRKDYDGSFQCPAECGSRELNFSCCSEGYISIACKHCGVSSTVTNSVPQYIYNYQPDMQCPNPNCADGWIFLKSIKGGKNNYSCRNCKVQFRNSNSPGSWKARSQLPPLFNFDDNVWDLRNFFKDPIDKSLNFNSVQPSWYQVFVKQYINEKLQKKDYEPGWFHAALKTLRFFGQVVKAEGLSHHNDFSRVTVKKFLETRYGLDPRTVNSDLVYLRGFFDWLRLDVSKLIYKRDVLKQSKNHDVEWLDEGVRKAIRQYLDLIPAPIARQYRIQEYTAARLGDACKMLFNCLVLDNGRWYIQFMQSKVQREHRLPATREIRRLIEEQQNWIREVFGPEYPYLFCHFWGIHMSLYPEFPNMRPLPEPPPSRAGMNQMVRTIRALIERENIRDSNGEKPHFTGKITRASRLQEVREQFGIEVASVYANHKSSTTTFQHYAPPTREQVARVDLPFQKILLNQNNYFLPWQSLPESLLNNPIAHELDIEIGPRLSVYGHCALAPERPCPKRLYPVCYGCESFRPSTQKLPLYERQYAGEQKRMAEAETAGEEIAFEEAKSVIEAMNMWLPDLRKLNNG